VKRGLVDLVHESHEIVRRLVEAFLGQGFDGFLPGVQCFHEFWDGCCLNCIDQNR